MRPDVEPSVSPKAHDPNPTLLGMSPDPCSAYTLRYWQIRLHAMYGTQLRVCEGYGHG